MVYGSNCHVFDSYIESKYTVYKASSTNPRHRERRQPPPRSVANVTKGVERLNFDDPMTQMTHGCPAVRLSGCPAVRLSGCASTEAFDPAPRDNVTI
jgi:hypothetical protein